MHKSNINVNQDGYAIPRELEEAWFSLGMNLEQLSHWLTLTQGVGLSYVEKDCKLNIINMALHYF